MQDSPPARAILAEVAAALRSGIAPGFQQAVSANALDLVLRETDLAAEGHAAERLRLVALLGREGELAELNGALARAIREGTLAADRDDLAAHLIRTTIEKIVIDQPRYPAFRQLIGDVA